MSRATDVSAATMRDTSHRCSAHYQKRRMLQKTKRLRFDTAEDPKPQSKKGLVLPRRRAGAKAFGDLEEVGVV